MPAHTYARFAEDLATAPVAEDVLHAARRCLIDWYATTLPGAVRPPASLLREALDEEVGRGRCRLLPDGLAASSRAAALINGAASHTVEFDDIFRDAIYHPGSPVIAAALAAAEREGVGGERLLRAVIAGYEVSNRIGAAVNPAHYTWWHTTATVGCFGAAVSAACVLGLDASRTAHAINGVTSMAAGLQQAFRSDAMTKPLHAGRAAEAGVLAALGARHGVTGAAGMLDGERGFGRAMSAGVDWQAAVAGLGEDWTITRTTQKNHGCCGHTFAALDAIIALRAEHGLAPADVESIRVGTYGAALEICGNQDPRTGYEGKFSLPYTAAVALAEGRVRLDAFDEAHLHDPLVREIMAKVTLELDPECHAAFPRRRSARVAVHLTDGRVLERHAPTRKGDPDAPLSDAELVDKYRELAAPVLGVGEAEVLDVLDDLRRLPLGGGAAARAAGG
jgi:2-methylcitrate dehydratase PrpD